MHRVNCVEVHEWAHVLSNCSIFIVQPFFGGGDEPDKNTKKTAVRSEVHKAKGKKGKRISFATSLTARGTHVPYRITHCHPAEVALPL